MDPAGDEDNGKEAGWNPPNPPHPANSNLPQRDRSHCQEIVTIEKPNIIIVKFRTTADIRRFTSFYCSSSILNGRTLNIN